MTKQLLVGLPSTGKTTFLAALWNVVESEEVPGSLQLERLEGDMEYLNSIREQWLTYAEVRRTPTGSTELVSMRLKDPVNGAAADLYLPDLAGETFREQWIQRRWDAEFADTAEGAEGILLFVHPHEVREPTTIREVAALQGLQALRDDEAGADEEIPWQPEHAPTQVQLVDLLQFLAQSLAAQRAVRLAVVISAWDIVLKQPGRVTPDQWIERRLPLLAQFLAANPEVFEHRVYGISAQGGDLREKGDRSALIEKEVPSKRIVVQHGDAMSHDLTAPIRWIMEGEGT